MRSIGIHISVYCIYTGDTAMRCVFEILRIVQELYLIEFVVQLLDL